MGSLGLSYRNLYSVPPACTMGYVWLSQISHPAFNLSHKYPVVSASYMEAESLLYLVYFEILFMKYLIYNPNII